MAFLQMRPGCECCDRDLPPTEPGAAICSFECTYCVQCAEEMHWVCKNCGGDLVARPMRVAGLLADYPPVTTRTFNPTGCPVHDPALVSASNPAAR